jgi:gamma-glutamyltranspeptidase/glutathione hydrolase
VIRALSLVLLGVGCQSAWQIVAGPVPARRGAVATANRAASEAAAEVLRGGGTAVDAAIAAVLVLGVVEPYSAGLGGGGFALVYDARNDAVTALDFRERAPAAATRDMYLKPATEPSASGGAPAPREVDGRASRVGWRAVAVPGTVHGLTALHQLLPSERSLADLSMPAIALADSGFEVTPLLVKRIAKMKQELAASPEMGAIFLVDGELPAVGSVIRQPQLAATLRRFARIGAIDWHGGLTGRRIAAAMRARGGLITLKDLVGYRVRKRPVLLGTFGDLEVATFPPPSSGGVHLLQMLDLLSRRERPASPTDSAWLSHRIEVMRRAYQDRARYLGDPDYTDVPLAGLLGSDHLDALHASIGPGPTPSTALDNPRPAGAAAAEPAQPAESRETTHLSIVDGQGNAVALTLTINYTFGAVVMAPGTGVILNNEMDDFSAAPGSPNAYGLVGGEANSIAPGKTPLSSMTPTFVFRKSPAGRRLALVIGSPGGSTIITTVLQIVTHMFWFGDDLATAIKRDRVHHQWLPDCVFVEPGRAAHFSKILTKNYTVCAPRPIGNAQGVVLHPDGRIEARSDPRGEGVGLEVQ